MKFYDVWVERITAELIKAFRDPFKAYDQKLLSVWLYEKIHVTTSP